MRIPRRQSIRLLRLVAGVVAIGCLCGCETDPVPPPEPTDVIRPVDPAVVKVLPVPLHRQEPDTGWCWAASGQMIMEFWGVTVSQCAQASRRTGTDCCGSVRTDNCRKGGWPAFGKYGFDSRPITTALDWPALRSQIDHRRPFVFSWVGFATVNGVILTNAHMMVAIGYAQNAAGNFVYVNDPGLEVDDFITIPYSDYVAPTGYQHLKDLVDIVKR